MLLSHRRDRIRRFLSGSESVFTASVYDPMSARMAESLGFEVGMLSGSVVSAAVLGAPDLALLTLTELSQQARRITRASNLSLIVDGDHGYGNALNVMRTVEELEAAGVAAVSIEDTSLPKSFGVQGQALISLPEMVRKLGAALEARQDPSLVIIARTDALRVVGIGEAKERVKAYQETGVDAIFIVGVTRHDQLEAIGQVNTLPLLLGDSPASLADRDLLAANGVRIALTGNVPFYVAAKAYYDALRSIREVGTSEEVAPRAAPEELLAIARRSGDYARWQSEYLA